MLKGIDELLTPDLLRALAAMGHNEWVAIVDANYTAECGWLPVARSYVYPGKRCRVSRKLCCRYCR